MTGSTELIIQKGSERQTEVRESGGTTHKTQPQGTENDIQRLCADIRVNAHADQRRNTRRNFRLIGEKRTDTLFNAEYFLMFSLHALNNTPAV